MINKLVTRLALVLVAVTLIGVFGNTSAFAKKEKVGTIANGWYSDSRFGFSLAITSDWKDAGLKDEISPERLSLTWRKARVPIKLRDNPDEALKPFIRIFVDSTDLTSTAFFDSLYSSSSKDFYRDKIASKSVFFERGRSNPAEIEPPLQVRVGGKNALRWWMKREYSVQVQKDENTPPELVRDYRVGYVYIVPGDGWLMYLEMACENQFRDEMVGEFEEIASSITFPEASADVDSAVAVPKENN